MTTENDSRRPLVLGTVLALVAAGGLILGACGGSDDDEAGVTDLGGDEAASGSASGSGSSSASGSASATGISAEDAAVTSDDPLVEEAVEGYRVYVDEQLADLVAETTVFTDAVRAGDVEAARAAYPVSRRPWERIEPIAGLIEDIDGAVDAREDDFDGPDDPDFTGWHRLEYHLWELEDLDGADAYADQLDADLAGLVETADGLELSAGVLTVGAQELIEEVAAPDGKLSGEEDRYSGTDLYDFQANVEGSRALVDLLAPALDEADPDLLATIEGQFDDLDTRLAELGSFEDGYPHYDEVTEDQRADLAADLGALAESLSLLNGALGLE